MIHPSFQNRREYCDCHIPGVGGVTVELVQDPESLAGMGGFFKSVGNFVKKAVSTVSKPFTKAVQWVGGKIQQNASHLADDIAGSNNFFSKALNKTINAIGTTAKASANISSQVVTGGQDKASREYIFGGGANLNADFRKSTGMTLSSAGKIVGSAIGFINPPLGVAINLALTARDVVVAKRMGNEAKKDYDAKVGNAYNEYVGSVNAVGDPTVKPVDASVFRGWIESGATGDIPLIRTGGVPSADGAYEAGEESPVGSALLPLLLVGGAVVLLSRRK